MVAAGAIALQRNDSAMVKFFDSLLTAACEASYLCVCVLASRWAILGPRAPLWTDQIISGRNNLTVISPPLGSITTFPYVLTGLLDRLFPYPRMAPSSWGYLFRVGGTWPI